MDDISPKGKTLGDSHMGTWSTSPLASWLADHEGQFLGARELLSQLCDRLNVAGIPVARANMVLRDAHPQIAARAFLWAKGEGSRETTLPFTDERSEEYLNSPIHMILDGAGGVRNRLDGANPQFDYPVARDLQEQGFTDYVAMPIIFSDQSRHFVSFASDQPGGFTVEQLTVIYDLMPLICLRLEVDHSRLVTQTFLNTYLGKGASQRVINGLIRRNEGDVIDAIIVYSDLRGFTRLADTLPADEVIKTLGIYYDTVAQPIEQSGGDIIKMMGDGMIAIFPYEDPMLGPCENIQACEAAQAVRAAHEQLKAIPTGSLPDGVDRLRAGFSLHIGPVTFGNVGSATRLDFTVIGAAVNEATRVEALTKTLGYPILATAAFAGLSCDIGLTSVGSHALRGVREPKEIFTLSEFF